jgi:hypothetical protein
LKISNNFSSPTYDAGGFEVKKKSVFLYRSIQYHVRNRRRIYVSFEDVASLDGDVGAEHGTGCRAEHGCGQHADLYRKG